MPPWVPAGTAGSGAGAAATSVQLAEPNFPPGCETGSAWGSFFDGTRDGEDGSVGAAARSYFCTVLGQHASLVVSDVEALCTLCAP